MSPCTFYRTDPPAHGLFVYVKKKRILNGISSQPTYFIAKTAVSTLLKFCKKKNELAGVLHSFSSSLFYLQKGYICSH